MNRETALRIAGAAGPLGDPEITLRPYEVRIESPRQCLTFEAMSEDSFACWEQHAGLAKQMRGKLKVRAL